MYTSYINNFDQALLVLSRVKRASEGFKAFLLVCFHHIFIILYLPFFSYLVCTKQEAMQQHGTQQLPNYPRAGTVIPIPATKSIYLTHTPPYSVYPATFFCWRYTIQLYFIIFFICYFLYHPDLALTQHSRRIY